MQDDKYKNRGGKNRTSRPNDDKRPTPRRTDINQPNEQRRPSAPRTDKHRTDENRRPTQYRSENTNRPNEERRPALYRSENTGRQNEERRTPQRRPTNSRTSVENSSFRESYRLNQYIARAGICSRRQADILIKDGKVKVNGVISVSMGQTITPNDKVELDGKQIFIKKESIYILLNKPKGFLSTNKDPEGRKTIFDLLPEYKEARLFPIGRLDRNTTGLMILTNDGDFAHELMHPSKNISKVYKVKVNRPFLKEDLEKLTAGLELEDGFMKPDVVELLPYKERTSLGIEIHSGRNRIVRRLFEALGYEIETLDRVVYSIFTKRDVPRGKHRVIHPQELRFLQQKSNTGHNPSDTNEKPTRRPDSTNN